MKILRVVVKTTELSVYEAEVHDDFDVEVMSDVHELFWEEGFDWPRVESENLDEEIVDYELVGD